MGALEVIEILNRMIDTTRSIKLETNFIKTKNRKSVGIN